MMNEDENLKTMEEVPTSYVIQNEPPIGKITFALVPNSVGITFLSEIPPKRTSCNLTDFLMILMMV